MNLCLRAALVLVVLAYLPQLQEQFEGPKAAVVRVIGIGLLAAALVSKSGAAHATRRPARSHERHKHAREHEPKPPAAPTPRPTTWRPLDTTMLVWLGIEVASTLTSSSRTISLFGDTDQHEGLLTSLGLAGLYAGARVTASHPQGARGALHAALWAVVGACAVALWQLASFTDAQWQNAAQYGAWHRPFGSLGHANLLGVMGAAGLAAAVGLARSRRGGRAWWLVATALFGVTIVLTLSRAAWLGALAGLGVVWVLRPGHHALRRPAPAHARPGRIRLLGLVVGAALVTVVVMQVEPLRARLLELFAFGSGSGRSRLEIWKTAVAMWQAHPWLGGGPDTFRLLFDRYQTPAYWDFEWGASASHAHSVYLSTLATRGIAGVLAAAAVLVASGLALIAAWRADAPGRALVPACVGMLVAFAVAGASGALGIAGAAVVAATLGLLPGLSVPREPAAAGGPGLRPWIVGGLASVAVLVPTVAEVRASHAAYQSSLAESSWEAVVDARRAVALAPWSDVMTANAADMLRRQADHAPDPGPALAEAESLASRSARLAPERLYNQSELMLVQLTRAGEGVAGADTRAVASMKRCMEIAPYNLFPLISGVDASMLIGRPDIALPAARRAIAIYPREGISSALLGRVALALGDSVEARAALNRSLTLTWHVDPDRRDKVVGKLQFLGP